MKAISKSQSKIFKLEIFRKCLDGEKYQNECNSFIIRSNNQEMYLQQMKKCGPSNFDDKRCYIDNIQSQPWE